MSESIEKEIAMALEDADFVAPTETWDQGKVMKILAKAYRAEKKRSEQRGAKITWLEDEPKKDRDALYAMKKALEEERKKVEALGIRISWMAKDGLRLQDQYRDGLNEERAKVLESLFLGNFESSMPDGIKDMDRQHDFLAGWEQMFGSMVSAGRDKAKALRSGGSNE